MERARGAPDIGVLDQPTPSGDRRFEEIYQQERPALVRTAFVLVRSQHVAEELVQEAFVRLYRYDRPVENPGGFLRTTTVRLAATWWRRDGLERDRLRVVGPAPAVAPTELDETWQALGRLKPERAVVLVLRFYEDLTHAEIAAAIGSNAATVRSRVRRGLADLRKELER